MMNDFLEKLAQNSGHLMGRYKIDEATNTLTFTSKSPLVTGTIMIGQDDEPLISRSPDCLRIDYGQAEIFLVPTNEDGLSGTFSAGIIDLILEGDTKAMVTEITEALKSIMA